MELQAKLLNWLDRQIAAQGAGAHTMPQLQVCPGCGMREYISRSGRIMMDHRRECRGPNVAPVAADSMPRPSVSWSETAPMRRDG